MASRKPRYRVYVHAHDYSSRNTSIFVGSSEQAMYRAVNIAETTLIVTAGTGCIEIEEKGVSRFIEYCDGERTLH